MRGVNRAERRRAAREAERGAARYAVSRDQIAAAAREQYREDVMREREAARLDAAGDAVALMLAMPITVLNERYGWPPEMLRGFVDGVLELYGEWERGEVSTGALERGLWEKCGVRLERDGRDAGDSPAAREGGGEDGA